MNAGRIMALDIGDRRIGVAFSDETRLIATPHSVYNRVGWGPDVKHLARLYQEQRATLIVSGLPLNMDGSEGFRVEETYKFTDALKTIYDGEIIYQDERLSTVGASRFLNETNTRGKKRKAVLDTVAACLILEQYLNSIKF